MKKHFSIFVLLLVVVLGSALLLTSCGGTAVHKAGDVKVDVVKGTVNSEGNFVKEQKFIEARYYTDGGIIELKGNKPSEMVIVSAVGDIKSINLADIENKVKADGENINVIGIGESLVNNPSDADRYTELSSVSMAPAHGLPSAPVVANGVFAEMNSLTAVDLTKKNASDDFTIEGGAFRNCKNLTSVMLPTNISSYANVIGISAFEGCEKLTSVTGLDKFDNMNNRVFAGCKSLTAIDLPTNLRFVPMYAFKDCEKLTTVKFNSNLEVIGNGAFENTAISAVDFNSLTNLMCILPDAFNNCKFTKVVLPDTILLVAGGAFTNNPLVEVDVPFISSMVDTSVTFEDVYGFDATRPELPKDYVVPTLSLKIRKAINLASDTFNLTDCAATIKSLNVTFVKSGKMEISQFEPSALIKVTTNMYVEPDTEINPASYAEQTNLTSLVVNGTAVELPAKENA